MTPAVLDQLRDLGIAITLDRPTGELRARPAPVPDRARELIRANRALIVAALEDPVQLLVDDDDLDAWVVGDLLPVDGDALDSYSAWVAMTFFGMSEDEIEAEPKGVHLPYWAPPDRPDWKPGTREPGDPPRWRRPPPTPAPTQAIRLGAKARERYIAKNGKVKEKKLIHVWAPCDVCGEGVMRKKGDKPKRCVMTPGARGTTSFPRGACRSRRFRSCSPDRRRRCREGGHPTP